MNVEIPVSPEVKELQEKNSRYVKMILDSAFAKKSDLERIAKDLNLAPTPKKVVYQECSVKLYRFNPVREKLAPTPVLLVPSLILRYYIMDLLTGHSLIEHLVNSGIDVYLIDWGVPGDENGKLTFDYYVDTFLRRAVRKVKRLSGSEKINLFGQCLGGTISTIYASLHQDEIAKLGTLTTPVDFEDAGLLSLWTQKENFDVDRIAESFGSVISAGFVHASFHFLDVKATVERYKRLYNNVLDENFMKYYKALDSWLNDKIPFPSQVYRRFIKDLYQENLLAKGKFQVNGEVANLGNIKCPVLNIISQFDHVFPEKSARRLNDLVKGPVNCHVIPAGHVTLIALFPEREKTFKLVSEFLQ